MINLVWEYSKRIQNSRTLTSIFRHADSEMDELIQEITNRRNNILEGEDGVTGEAVDVILCMLDIIHQANPETTESDVLEIVKRKCDKWERKYGSA